MFSERCGGKTLAIRILHAHSSKMIGINNSESCTACVSHFFVNLMPEGSVIKIICVASKTDEGNRLVDTGAGKGRRGRIGRVGLTYIH